MSAEHAELKNLQRRIEESKVNLKSLNEQRREVDEKIRHEQGTLTRLNGEVDKLKKKNGKLVVSEHALLRYFERVLKFNLEEIKKKILPEKLEIPIKTMGSGTFPADTHRVKVKDGVVITILTDDEE